MTTLNYKKILLAGAAVLTGLLAGAINSAQAQSFQILSVAEAGTPESISAAERKEILAKIISQSEKESNNLEKKVSEMKLPKDWQNIKGFLLSQIADFKKYYGSVSEKLTDEKLTDDDVKNIALEVRAWREKNYSKQLGDIADFILVFETDSLLNTVGGRLSKIASDINRIEKQKLMKTDAIREIYDKADKRLKIAISLNEKAKGMLFDDLFAKLRPATEEKIKALQAIPLLLENASTSPVGKGAEPKESVREVSKSSLKELKATYEIFFQMNETLKKN